MSITSKLGRLALAAAVTGLVMSATPASAQQPTNYTLTSPSSFTSAGCTESLEIRNPASTPLPFTITQYGTISNNVLESFTWMVSPSIPFVRGRGSNAGMIHYTVSGTVVPVVTFTTTCNGNTKTYSSEDWRVTNANGSTSENLQRTNSVLDSIAAKVDAVTAKVNALTSKADATNAKVDSVTAKVDGLAATVNALATKVGNKKEWTCVGGSVRTELNNRSQMYLTVLNPATSGFAFPVSVWYSTSRGRVFRQYYPSPSVPLQIDVSAALVGIGGAYPLAPNVDTAITVSHSGPVQISCTVYFTRLVPNVGFVTGVQELPVSSN